MKIAHLADLHLGYRAYTKLNERGINLREFDVLETFREVLRKINQIQPNLIIIAGDVFHKPRPSNLTIFRTIQLLRKFRETCNAPIVTVSGNHECTKTLESGSILGIFEAVVPNFHLIDGTIKELELKSLDTLVVGVPYNALGELKEKSLSSDKTFKYNILSMHGSYDSVKCPELSAYGKEELITSEALNQPAWDYIAFGHYHTYTKLAENAYYSGSIERTSTNIWKEAKEDKGFILYDLKAKQIEFVKLASPRKVIDLKKINAENLTSEDINLLLISEMDKIKDLQDKIVRVTIENIDTVAVRTLDYKKIREWKKTAVHFRLNLIKKESSVNVNIESGELITGKKSLYESLQDELAEFDLSQGLNRDDFAKMAKQYLELEKV